MNFSSLGHHFIVGISGTTLSDLDKRILGELSPAGVLLLKRNFLHDVSYEEMLSGYSDLNKQIHEYSGREKMIITIDHESERVHRLPPPFTKFPNALYTAEFAYQIGKAHGGELKTLGINLSWSPVADINSNPNNPVIGERSFGSDPETVAVAASQYLKGLQECGVLGCAKHFPGHGDTKVDSHLDLPVLSLTESQIMQRELIPFAKLIDDGISIVMSSHILFDKIDRDNPATLSETILQGILRDKLGFDGVIVTDDLDMKAISERYSLRETVEKAVCAGCELFIVARYPDSESQKPLFMAEELLKTLAINSRVGKNLEMAQYRLKVLNSKLISSRDLSSLNSELLAEHEKLNAGIRSCLPSK